METAALDLLGLPDDLLSGALSRFCSVMALVSLSATCARLRGLCKQAAEVLLEEAGTAATTIAESFNFWITTHQQYACRNPPNLVRVGCLQPTAAHHGRP